MKKIVHLMGAGLVALSLAGLGGCSDEAKQKWKETGQVAKEAVKQTAHDTKEATKELAEKAKEKSKVVMAEVKEGAQHMVEKGKEVLQQAKATDPDTGQPVQE